MRSLIVASAATVVLLTAAVSGPLSAQNAQGNGKDATKVYAYKKTAPTQPNPSAYVPSTDAPPRSAELIPNTETYGSVRWWDLMGRSMGGSDGGSQ
jgi:hypothetical protein